MSATRPPPIPGPIRITPEEANSPHVDDLLSRQASLRGEGGISRTSKGKWYLQNWFIFMIAGALGARVVAVDEIIGMAISPTAFFAASNFEYPRSINL